MANSALISTISTTCQTILSVMKEYKRSFTYKNCIEFSGAVWCNRNGKEYAFDCLVISERGISAYDYKHYQIGLANTYGAGYFGCSAQKFMDDEVYTRHYEGVGFALEMLEEDTLNSILSYLEYMLDDFKYRFPREDEAYRQMKEEADAKQALYDSLPFMERYYINQYGWGAWKTAFKH